ncbi:MAG: hypothetical protein ACYTGP_05515 [Planctomycetota bacterium]|jgi:hypothetical protein
MTTAPAYRQVSDITRLVRSFEECSLPAERWDHRAYLTVAIWYMIRLDELEAAQRVVDGLRRFNRARGAEARTGYHETITLFWLGVTRAFLADADRTLPATELANRFLDVYGDRPDLPRRYFSDRLIRSWRARHGWVEPDLRPLDF